MNETIRPPGTAATKPTARRRILQQLGAAATAAALPSRAARAATETIRIGYVSPMTGPLGSFGETDKYTVEKIRKLLADGLTLQGRRYAVEVLVRDSQSNPNKAAELAGDLILNEKVHLMVPASTTDVNNPVADQCEMYGVPSISSGSPWQSFIFPRGGSTDKPFQWTYHFFWGLEDALSCYVGLWSTVETNRRIGMLFPRNADGDAWGNKEWGLPPAVAKAGFEAVIPSYFQPRTNDFSAQIAEYKRAGVDIVGGIAYPGDLKTFIVQCRQQQFTPRVVTVAAALLFPSGVEALGALGDGMSTEVWWTPAFPFRSSLTGETCQKLADDWEQSSKKQWTQPIGYAHANWEVAIDVLRRSANPLDRAAIRDALRQTNLTTVAGPIRFEGGPHPNIAKTPVIGGQWVKGARHRYELKIVDNTNSKLVPVEGRMQLISWKT